MRLETERLILREWCDNDLAPFAEMNADPAVMHHFPDTVSREVSDQAVGRIRQHFTEHGFGLWAVEIPGLAPFIGFVGMHHVPFEAHFTPAVEIGWRLALQYQGKGYATEAARRAAAFGFETIGLEEIVSFTVPANQPSRRVMEKLGMRHDPAEDFEHPRLPKDHPLSPHVLYRLRRPQ